MKNALSKLSGFAACLVLCACVASCAHRLPPDEIPAAVLPAADVRVHRPADAAPSVPPEPLSLGITNAVFMALEHNAAFRVERLRPAISRADELTARSAFDTTLSVSASTGQATRESATNESDITSADTDTFEAEARLTKSFGLGTTIEAGVNRTEDTYPDNSDRTERDDTWDVTLTQSLLRGVRPAANLARVRQAELNTEISAYELRGAAETLVAQVERAYWDCILAERSIEIHERALEVANREVEEVKERIQVGRVAEAELAAAEAEAAGRREELIGARGTVVKRRLALIRLLNLPGPDGAWNRPVELKDSPEIEAVPMNSVEEHVQLALERRADLCQARLQVRRGDLEVIRTRNGLLPRLDLFVSMGGSRYAESFGDQTVAEADDVANAVGLILEFPLENREARADRRRARFSAEQAEASLENMEQLAQIEVRSAYVDVESAAERMKATKATRELREKTLANEQEKFRVGRSTTFLVSQARQEAVRSQIAEVDSVIGYRKALLELCRTDGSILPRRSIDIP